GTGLRNGVPRPGSGSHRRGSRPAGAGGGRRATGGDPLGGAGPVGRRHGVAVGVRPAVARFPGSFRLRMGAAVTRPVQPCGGERRLASLSALERPAAQGGDGAASGRRADADRRDLAGDAETLWAAGTGGGVTTPGAFFDKVLSRSG